MNRTSSSRKSRRKKKLGAVSGRPKRVRDAAGRAIRQALKAHKAAGVPIVVWRNGKIVRIPASEI